MPEYIRNPLCQRPVSATSSMDWMNEQAARIVDLDGKLANARGRIVDLERDLHDANGETTRFQGAVQLIALMLGLDADAPPPEVVAEARRRLK